MPVPARVIDALQAHPTLGVFPCKTRGMIDARIHAR